jgi:DNA polymerase (family 10)
MDNPHLALLSRTIGRLIGEREGCDVDVERVLLRARERGCAIDRPALPKAMSSVPGAIS